LLINLLMIAITRCPARWLATYTFPIQGMTCELSAATSQLGLGLLYSSASGVEV
jgi:hypothetical protein